MLFAGLVMPADFSFLAASASLVDLVLCAETRSKWKPVSSDSRTPFADRHTSCQLGH